MNSYIQKNGRKLLKMNSLNIKLKQFPKYVPSLKNKTKTLKIKLRA